MLKRHSIGGTLGLAGVCAAILIAGASPLAAQFPKVVYEIQSGSSVLDECVTCDRAPIPFPISGSFVLQRSAVKILGELYGASDIDIACVGCPEAMQYSLNGEGTYYLQNPEIQTSHLDLVLNGGSHVLLEAPAGEVSAPWPLIDVTLTEDGTRDPNQKLTIRLIAAPKIEMIPYQLVTGNLKDGTGSILEIVCPVCRLINSTIPLEGTMLVGLAGSVVDGFSVYRLDQIDWNDVLDGADYAITGSGSYEEGGVKENLKRARLTLATNSTTELRVLTGGPVAVEPGTGFPIIDITVEEAGNKTLWYRLHLVARPAGKIPFRRSDANADGAVDITDPVYHLTWSFTGGPAPPCLDAADSNADGVHDLTDAIFTLEYLFLSGEAPPAPGPLECGTAEDEKFGCLSYSCASP